MFRKLWFVTVLAILFSISPTSLANAEDYETPHTFQAGDTLSADVLNEIFAYIQNSKKPVTMSALVGTWSCTKYIAGDTYSNMTAYYETPDTDALWHYLNVTVVFADDADGTYSWSSATYNAFTYGASTLDNCDGSGKVSLYQGKFAVTADDCPTTKHPDALTATRIFIVKPVTGTRVEISQMGSSADNGIFLTCDKQNLPPSNPTTLSATSSGLVVTLSWTDKSSDETGFKVLRRDSLEGSWTLITTTSADATTYTDTVTASGTYWYRVQATNANGDSLGTNVETITPQ